MRFRRKFRIIVSLLPGEKLLDCGIVIIILALYWFFSLDEIPSIIADGIGVMRTFVNCLFLSQKK